MIVSRYCFIHTVFVAVTAVFVVAVPRSAQCCTCIALPSEISPREAESYSLIIDAKVIGLEYFDPSQNENPELGFESDVRVIVSVNRSWLGSVPEQLTLWTLSEESACGYQFKVGSSYLVFVRKGYETVGLCGRTCNIEAAAEIEAQLNEVFGKPIILKSDRSTQHDKGA